MVYSRTIVSTALLLMLAGPCLAADATDLESCMHDRDPEAAIAACTRVVQDPGDTPGDRAAAFTGRGTAYYEQRNPDRAIADLDAAIALAPEAATYVERGLAYRLTNLNQHVPYSLPTSILPCLAVHLLIGALLFWLSTRCALRSTIQIDASANTPSTP